MKIIYDLMFGTTGKFILSHHPDYEYESEFESINFFKPFADINNFFTRFASIVSPVVLFTFLLPVFSTISYLINSTILLLTLQLSQIQNPLSFIGDIISYIIFGLIATVGNLIDFFGSIVTSFNNSPYAAPFNI